MFLQKLLALHLQSIVSVCLLLTLNHIFLASPEVFRDKGIDCDDCNKYYLEHLDIKDSYCVNLPIDSKDTMIIVKCDESKGEYIRGEDCRWINLDYPKKYCFCNGLCYIRFDTPLENYKPKINCNGSKFCN